MMAGTTYRGYELVAGLETHVELSTASKIFCSCSTAFGGEPNTHCCPVCIGLPGTLPRLNRQVVRYAVLAGLATNCRINRVSRMDRKNYVYPDLPKAYQITQYDTPLCEHGFLELSNGRKIRLARIHMEEDAGKLIHTPEKLYIDYNRGGVPLIEIVTEPDFRSGEEMRDYLEKLQQLMRYIGVSDCRMQEGSLRCDVNISARPVGSDALGTRTEIKNMNSFTYLQRAVDYEFRRQAELLESGEKVVQETRRYEESTGRTETMRGKEDADDYRYFREPDLMTIEISEEEIESLRASLPELPDSRIGRYVEGWGIPEKDARLLAKYRAVADYFVTACQGVTPRTVANLMLGPVFRRLDTEAKKEIARIPLPPERLRELVALMDRGQLRMNLAKSTLETMLDTGKSAMELLSEADLAGVDDETLLGLCRQAVEENPGAAADYRNGKEKALKALVGFVMRATKGAADAEAAQAVLAELLKA